ncbi:MAG: alpha/beta fold hydrolase [SAR324 cluster bacterium]
MPSLERDGVRIEYREAGHGEAAILIHSSASGLGQWRRLMDAIAPRFRAIAYHLYGCGETTAWPGIRPQSMRDQAALTVALADRVGGPVHLVGHSFGGSVAMKAALALGPRLASLALLEPNPFYLLQQHGRSAAYAESCALRDHVKRFGAVNDWERVAERFADYWNAPGAWAAMSPERRQIFLRMLPGNFHEWDAVMDETDTLSTLVPVAARTLVVTAEDTVRPIREIAELMAVHLPGLTWQRIPQGGHMAPVTRPDLVNPLVIAHLERFAARPPAR